MVFTEFIGTKYPNYFKTSHWYKLKEKYLYSDRKVACWICEKTSTLLLHHVSYENLFNEKLGVDIFIVCFDCHTKIHFQKRFFFFQHKTKLDKRILLKRMRYLRVNYYIKKRRFGRALWNQFLYAMS